MKMNFLVDQVKKLRTDLAEKTHLVSDLRRDLRESKLDCEMLGKSLLEVQD